MEGMRKGNEAETDAETWKLEAHVLVICPPRPLVTPPLSPPLTSDACVSQTHTQACSGDGGGGTGTRCGTVGVETGYCEGSTGAGRRWGGRAVRSPSDVQVFLLLEEKETGRGSSSSFARTLCVCVCDRKSTCVCVRARQRDE